MQIERGLPTAHIANWMETSDYMIPPTLNRFLLDRECPDEQ
jgi:hypothetical protein